MSMSLQIRVFGCCVLASAASAVACILADPLRWGAPAIAFAILAHVYKPA